MLQNSTRLELFHTSIFEHSYIKKMLSYKKLKIAPGDNTSTRKYMTHNTKFTHPN